MDKRLRNRNLTHAVDSGDIELFTELVGDDESVLQMMTPWGTWLHLAAKAGQLKMVEHLLLQGLPLNVLGGTFGGSALNLAASYGREEVVRYLISQGARLDTDEPERNPLFSAVQGGHRDIVLLLLKAGIDASVKYSGETMKEMDAAAFAKERGQLDLAEVIEHWQGA